MYILRNNITSGTKNTSLVCERNITSDTFKGLNSQRPLLAMHFVDF